MSDRTRSDSMARRSNFPCPRICSCPANSGRSRGRILQASGTLAGSPKRDCSCSFLMRFLGPNVTNSGGQMRTCDRGRRRCLRRDQDAGTPGEMGVGDNPVVFPGLSECPFTITAIPQFPAGTPLLRIYVVCVFFPMIVVRYLADKANLRAASG
jgi:hypothetical protein